jgi:hypothetical protein
LWLGRQDQRGVSVARRPTDGHRTIFYQYRTDRATRTLRGIDEQIAKAEKAIKGQAAVKRNRFVQLTGGTRTINRTSRAKTRALAGLKGCAKHAAGWVRCFNARCQIDNEQRRGLSGPVGSFMELIENDHMDPEIRRRGAR